MDILKMSKMDFCKEESVNFFQKTPKYGFRP